MRKNWEYRLKPIIEKKLQDINKVYNDHISKLEIQIENIELDRQETVRTSNLMKTELEERLKTGIVEIIGKKLTQKAAAFEEEKLTLQKKLSSVYNENYILKQKNEYLKNKTPKNEPTGSIVPEEIQIKLKNLKSENSKWSLRFIDRENDYKKLLLEFNKLKSKETVMQKLVKSLETEISNVIYEKENLQQKLQCLTDRKDMTIKRDDQVIGSPDRISNYDPRNVINSKQISSRSTEIDRNLYIEMKNLYQDMKGQLAAKVIELQNLMESENNYKQQFNSALSAIEELNQKNFELNEKVQEIEKNLCFFMNEFDQIFSSMKKYEISEEQNFKELSKSFCNFDNFSQKLDKNMKYLPQTSDAEKQNIITIKNSISNEYTNLIKYTEYLSDKIEVKNSQIKQLKFIFSKHYSSGD